VFPLFTALYCFIGYCVPLCGLPLRKENLLSSHGHVISTPTKFIAAHSAGAKCGQAASQAKILFSVILNTKTPLIPTFCIKALVLSNCKS